MIDGDKELTPLDLRFWVHDLRRTYFGDANLDGEFNSSDLTDVFTAFQYEDAVEGNSTWATGDWSGNGEFDSADLVLQMDACCLDDAYKFFRSDSF